MSKPATRTHSRHPEANPWTPPANLCRPGSRTKYFYDASRWELYNLATDIREASNLAPTQPERLMTLARKMARELVAHGALYPDRISGSTPVPPVMPNLPTVDSDGDGIPDNTEDANRNGLVDPGETNPDLADTDGDLTPDGAEARLGTDPLNAASRFTVSTKLAGGDVLLSWPSRTGAVFRVEQALALFPAWWVVAADDVPGQSSFTTNSLPLPPGSASAFYRVLLK